MKLQNLNLSQIKTPLVESLKEMMDRYNNDSYSGKLKLDFDRPIGEVYPVFEDVASVLEEVLGVQIKEDYFTWKREGLGCGYDIVSFYIGTQKIELTATKSLQYLVDEIMNTIAEELLAIQSHDRLISYIANDSFGYEYPITVSEFKDTKEIAEFIEALGKSRYCDKEFETILEQLGYQVKSGSFHDLYDGEELRYVVLEELDTKLWLDVLYQPYTMYRSCKPRLRNEVLYILLGLKFGEAFLCDEF